MSDRTNVEEWFIKWTRFVQENDINFANVWNFDETGFMIGYLMNGIMIWTFTEIDNPILTDAHTTISVTVTESISAEGEIIAPFIIMPGVQIPSCWVDNDLVSRAGLGNTGERGTLQAERDLLLRIGTAGRSGSIDKT
ncbi:hypothetical protein FPOA_11993 [Fusarium poae]|uniref:DDE-1 domain-containing protein n=1 Tax=Fusarium poae TaxID=36050 RepID=A0A1B8A4S6_FUSPO|nr:hypothetical protein FPOA_13697 [Fusarium poae]OBS16740.1 hypothetical protein FPOA_12680 [Fusarium poae]OBS17553.1 hypothetical protein FPOA_11993 [Fusarium poae]